MYEQLKRRAGMLAAVAALTAVILAALPGAAEAQEEKGTHEGPTSNSRPAPDAPTNQVVVAPGDSLWAIAQRHLGTDATPQQVANEVERIFELNRARIGDNPDLILAGQELSLAPVSGPLGTVPEPEPVVVAGPVAAAANEQPVAEEQPAAAGREVEQTEEPKQLPEPSPTQEDASAVAGSLPEPDNTQRRLVGLGVLALTLLLVILLALRLPMRRNVEGLEARGTFQRYPDRRVPSYDVSDEREGAPRTAVVGSTHPERTLGGSGSGAPAKGNGSGRPGIALAAGGRRKEILQARAPGRKRLLRRKRHVADVYSPQLRSVSRRARRRTEPRRAAAIKSYARVLVMGLALSLAILSVLPGMTKAKEMASVQDTPTANQNADATTVQSEPSDQLLVYPGDSLWSISQERLGPSASPKQIADEVGRTFELNRDRIGDDPNLILVGQELLRPPPAAPVKTATNEPTPASEPASVEIVASDPEPTSEPAAAEPPLEVSAEASTEAGAQASTEPAVLPELPEADAELVSASVQGASATPEGDGDARRKAGYAVLLFTVAVALFGTARLLAGRR